MNLPPKAVLKTRSKRILFLLLFLSVFLNGKLWAQGCECIGCQGPIPVSSTNTYTLNISGATNNNLSDPGQGICGIYLDVTFEHIWSLTITLTSPAGQTITLMGPYDNYPGTTGFSNWDISFLPCSETVSPDPLASGGFFNDQWTNLQQWAFFTNYTGSYYPYIGCLEDFTFGGVNGDWTMTVTNGSSFYDDGSFNGFSILFCDESGMGCTACDANAGDLSGVNDIDLCIGESYSGSIDPFYSFGSEPNNQYDYTYIISQGSIIENYEASPDFSTFSEGIYEICGLSYLTADAASIPPPDGSFSVPDLETILVNSSPLCGDISDDCFTVIIYEIPDTVFITDVFCAKEEYEFAGNTYSLPGVYYPILTASVGCDTAVELTLSELPISIEDRDETICEGDTLFIGNSFYVNTGTYADTFVNIFGCDSIINLELTVLDPQIIIDVPETVLCSNPEIELNASSSTAGSGVSYIWSTNDGNITGSTTDNITTVDEGGTYYFTLTMVTNGVVCSAIDSVIVVEDLVDPLVNAGVDSTLNCMVTSIVLDGNGSSIGSEFSYEWITVDGNIVQDTFTLSPLINSAGTYVLNIINSDNGCVSQDSVLILENNTLPIADGGIDFEINCDNPIVQLDGLASSQGNAFIYLWTTSDGNILSGGDGLEPMVDSIGTYQLIVTDTFNHCTATDLVEVTVDTIPPVADAGTGFTLNCITPQAQVDGSNSSQGGAFSYQWIAISGGPIISGSTTLTPTVNVEGVYELTVTNDLTGCSSTSQVTVNEDFVDPLIVVEIPIDTITCSANTIFIDATNSSTGVDFEYEWTVVGTGNIVSDTFSLQPQIGAEGMYQLEITNTINGCTVVEMVEVFSNNSIPIANAGANMIINCNQDQVTLMGSGSVGGEFQYLWTASNGGNIVSGATTFSPVVDEGGDYELLVTDTLSGCTQTDITSVTVDTIPPIADAGIDTLIDCYNNTITLDGSNSSQGNFNYFWSTSDGVIDSDETTIQPAISASGNYEIIVTNNQNGCTSFDSVFVDENFISPIADAGIDTFITCTNPIIFLNGTNSSVGNFSYQWTASNGGFILSAGTTLQPEINSAGNYQLDVTNLENGCTAIDEVIVTADNNLPTATAGLADTLDCNEPIITLDGTGSSTGINITYLWTTSDGNILLGENTLQSQVDSAGTYLLTVSDLSTGCSALSSVEIAIDTILPIADAGETMMLNCLNSSVVLDGTNSSTGSGISYFWNTNDGNIISNQNTLQPTVNQEGMYYLEITNNNNNCVSNDSVFVSENINQPLSIAGVDTIITCTNQTIVLDGTSSSMGINDVYQWTATNGGIIINNATTLQPEVGAQGNYELLVTDTISGCSAIDFLIVDIDIIPPNADAGQDDVIDCSQSILTLDGSNSSTGSIFNYQWTTTNGNILSGENGLSPQVDSAGIYTLEVTNTQNGCTNNSFVEITIDTITPIADAGGTMMINCLTPTVVLDGTNSSAGNDFSYSWNTNDGNIVSNQNGFTPTVNQEGMYYLEVTNDSNNCVSNDSVFVSENVNQPVSIAGVDTIITCTNQTIILDGTSSSMGINDVYQWAATNGGIIINNASTLQPEIGAQGNYELVVTDTISGCSASDFLIVDIDIIPPTVDAGQDDVIDCNQSILTLDGSNSSIGSIYNYEWTTTSGNILSGENGLSPQVDSAGIYILEVTNTQNGCTNISAVTISADTILPIANAGIDTMITCESIVINLNGNGSSIGNFTYNWTTTGLGAITDGNTLAPEINDSGIYQIEVTNTQNGCIAIDEVEVVWDTISPIADAGQNGLLDCDITSLTLGGNSSVGANFEYQWSFTSGGNILTDPTQPTINVNAGATYTLLITNTLNSCTASDEVVVSQNANLPIAMTNLIDSILCDSTQLTLDGSGSSMGIDITYNWTTLDGSIVADTNTLFPLVDSAGIYTLTVTDTANNCEATAFVNVLLEDCGPIVNAGIDGLIDCNSPTIILDGTGSSVGPEFAYLWTTSDGNILSDTMTLMPTVNAGGTYVLIVENTTNGEFETDTVFVTDLSSLPSVVLSVNTLLGCVNTSVLVDGSGSSMGVDYLYSWTTNDGSIGSVIGDTAISVNEAGTYILEITNNTNGCVTIDSIEVFQNVNLPVADAGSEMQLNCYNNIITLDGTGSSQGTDYIYLWTTSDGSIISGETTLVPMVDSVGTYILEVTDTTNGCNIQSMVMVTEDFITPIVNVGLIDTLTCVDSVLTLDGTASSQGINFVYQWMTIDGHILSGENSLIPEIDSIGNYQLIVLDTLNGCSDSSSVFIDENFIEPTANAGMDQTLDCGIGSILLDGAGSSIGNEFTYLWTTSNGNIQNNNNTLTPEISSGGNYILTIENLQNGCTVSDEVIISSMNCDPLASISLPDTLTCLTTEITLDGSASSDWASINYQWDTPDGNIVGVTNTPLATINLPGTYQLVLTDTLTNNIAFTSVVVEINDTPPAANAGEPDTLNCAVSVLNLNGSNSSIGNNITYEWTTNDGNIVSGFDEVSPIVNVDGMYDLMVTNIENGCTAISSVEIFIDTISPIADAGIAPDLTCVNTLLFLDGLSSSIGSSFSYEWNTNDGNIVGNGNVINPEINEAGTYELTVTNEQNFCEATDSIIVDVDTIAPTILIEPVEVLNCELTEFNIDAIGSSSGNNFTVQWITNNGNILSGDNSLSPQVNDGGEYELTILNTQNGCSSVEVISVSQDTISPISNAGNTMELNCTDTILTLDGSGSSSGNEFIYQWLTGNGNIQNGDNSLFPIINVLGNYELIVTSNNNMCTSTSMVQITQDITAPIAIIDLPDTLNCVVEEMTLSANNSSNGLDYSYLWSTTDGNISFGETSLNPQISDGGFYYLEIVNNENGCTSMASAEVTQDTILPIAEAGSEMTLNCLDTILSIDAGGSSVGNEFTYLWTTNNGNIISGGDFLNPQVDELGIYQLEITNNVNQCISNDSVEIFENIIAPEIEVNAIGGLILNCNVSSIVLDASGSTPIGNVSFEWNTTNGNILSGVNDPNPGLDLEGDYSLILTNDINGCTATEMVEISADFEEPIINILQPEILTCEDSIITLSGSGSSVGNEFTYLWTTVDGNIISGATNLDCNIDAAGSYLLIVSNIQNGCSTSTSIEVFEDVDPPFADAGGHYEFDCIQNIKMLDAEASEGNEFTYLWTTTEGNILSGVTSLQPIVNDIGIYTLTVTNQLNGCTASSDALVTEDLDVPEDIEVNITQPLCYGGFNGSIEILDVMGGEAPYLYSIDDLNFTEYPIFSYLPAGNYSITVKDASGCEWNTIIEIQETEEVQVDLGDDVYIELGESTNLQAITNISIFDLDSVSWTTLDSLECDDCLEQDIAPFVTTAYSIFLMNENGCITDDDVIVYVNNKKRIFIPNAFSPNGDGNNDQFMIYGGLGVKEIENFQIFSRWGELVFEKNNFQPNDPTMGWNGFFQGEKMNPAVFVFFAKIKYSNGETEVVKGDLFLK